VFPEGAGPDEANYALDRLLLRDALAQLSAEHRAVVWRSYYLRWTTAQIADDLHIAEGTLKSRLHYALLALRLTLQEMEVTRWRQSGVASRALLIPCGAECYVLAKPPAWAHALCFESSRSKLPVGTRCLIGNPWSDCEWS
jgi:hypothetical protein